MSKRSHIFAYNAMTKKFSKRNRSFEAIKKVI